jgi:serine/threonine protein kinase/WD40 repeat protein
MDTSSGERSPVELLAEEFVARKRRGEQPSIPEYAARYPALAEEIRELFPALLMVEDLGAESLPATGPHLAGAGGGLELKQLGDYRILREVGRGGMGVVYEAEQQALGRRVALKVLPGHALRDPNKLHRFEREARAAARLHHTNIVPVFGVGCHEGTHYYVMQFIQGLGFDVVLTELKRLRRAKGLTATLGRNASCTDADAPSAVEVAQALLTGQFRANAEGGLVHEDAEAVPKDSRNNAKPSTPSGESSLRLPSGSLSAESGRAYWQSMARLGVQVAEALAYAHGQGVLHRDIKPSNLLLDLRGTVWVTDFGLAKAAADGDDLTHTGDIVGTIRYMAPERFEGRSDGRSDLYSLGLTLYELLVLRPAFLESDRNKLIHQVTHAEPTPPRKLNPTIPRDLETIVLKAMAREPGHRYQAAVDLADDLQRFVEDKPIRARPVSSVERLWRWSRRNPALASLTTAVTVLLVAVTLGALIAAVWNGRLAKDADLARQSEADAHQNEAAARQKAELTVTDLFTSQGLMAGEREDPAQAVLWFANAARLAGAGTERESDNRARVASWSRQALQPMRALPHAADWVSRVQFHSTSRYVLTQTHVLRQDLDEEGDWTLWDLNQETPLPLPAGIATASSAAWSPDGRWLALGTPQGEVLLCSFPEGKVQQRLAYGGRIHSLAFSPDGHFLALASAHTVEGKLIVATNGQSLSPWYASAQALADLNWSVPSLPSTLLALRVLPSYTVRVWDRQAGAFVTPELWHSMPVAALVFHPRGHPLVVSCWDQRARVFAIPNQTGEPFFPPVEHRVAGFSWISGDYNPPNFLDKGRGFLTRNISSALIPDGPPFVGLVWRDAETGAVIRTVPRAHKAVVVSSDDKYFAAGFGNVRLSEGIQILEVATGHPISPLLRNRERQLTSSAAFSPDGRTLWTSGTDRMLRRWSVPSGQALGRPIDLHATVNLVASSPDGRLLATAQRGGLVRIWAVPTDDPRHASLLLDGGGALAKRSRDGLYVVATGQITSIAPLRTRVYEIASGQPAGPPLETGGILTDAAFSPDRRQVATLVSATTTQEERGRNPYRPGQVQLWNWRTGQCLCDPLDTPSEPRSLDYSPDGQRLAVFCSRGQLLVIHPLEGRRLLQWQAYAEPFRFDGYWTPDRVRFSPDGQSLVTYFHFGGDSKPRVWDAATGRERYAALDHPAQRAFDVQFSSDGRLLTTTATDNAVRIWDFATGRPVAEPLMHPDMVFTGIFSADGSKVLTACRDGMARLWDWRIGQLICPPFTHENEVHVVAFHPNGRWILTASTDKTMRVWEWRTGKPITAPFALSGFGLGLDVTPDGNYAVVGGYGDALKVFYLGELSARNELDADDLCTWAELVSGQRVHQGSGVTNLTAEEWLERWREFRRRHPDYGKIDLNSPANGPGR